MVNDERKLLLIDWLKEVLLRDDFSCEPASSDASFRRYFRVQFDDQSYVVMDAPPDKEDCTSFIKISEQLVSLGVNAPKIFYKSLEKGFLVLSDLGTESYLENLSEAMADKRYDDAIQVLHKMHQITLDDSPLPSYSFALLQQEMSLFEEWFVNKLLGVSLSGDEKNNLNTIQQVLADSALEQPQVFVHRDYHSRNLMVTNDNNPGVIDFQDAVVGPLTYDLVSLYRDCYIQWPDEKVYEWLDGFLKQRTEAGHADEFDKARFYQWFDWMGVQRHLKVLGIFSRLLLRDGKSGYLKDIPLTLSYIIDVCKRYDELKPLLKLIEIHQLAFRFEKKQAELEAE